jgi:hypothetical protein
VREYMERVWAVPTSALPQGRPTPAPQARPQPG